MADQAQTTAFSPIQPTPATSRSILWAEDNGKDRALIRECLDGYPGVMLVNDGVHLLEALAKTLPNLVVLDLKMPRLGGIDALRKIRSHPEWQSLRVVIFSSGERPDEIAQCRTLGALDIVEKPVDFDVFTAAVHRVLRFAEPAGAIGVSPVRPSGQQVRSAN